MVGIQNNYVLSAYFASGKTYKPSTLTSRPRGESDVLFNLLGLFGRIYEGLRSGALRN
jgi:hypothetical protein